MGKNSKIKNVAIVLLVPVVFLFVALFTLPHYGISWDEPIHFYRGQAYFHYFLTGNKEYDETRGPWQTYFQYNGLSAKYFIEEGDGGHPPLNDILASAFNYLFYEKLHLVGDINSYHIFNVTAGFLAVVTVAVFSYMTYGIWASIVSSVVMATYPLFFGEVHFNIKDPAETGFISVAIFTFWLATKKGNWKWLLLSSIFSGLALGTKFNAFFIPVMLAPFLVFKSFPFVTKGINRTIASIKKIPRKFIVMAVFYPAVVLGIFFASWPYLWGDPIGNFQKVFHYYQDIGTGSDYQPGYYLPGKINAYPSFWILTTTPPVVLILAVLGLLISCYLILGKDTKDRATIVLFLSWLFIPIIRVTLPDTSIYGGVRQIMEYIPGLALVCGIGVAFLIKKLKLNSVNSTLILLILFLPEVFLLARLHPNENVYFNSIIGGLSGATKSGVPYAGNSFGNAYWPLLQWMNKNAEQDAHIALVQGTALNIPDIQLRPDIRRWNNFWSGIDRKGEYLIELTYNNSQIAYPYAWNYIYSFLDPVSEVVVDGVPIARLWKNDLAHTKENMKFNEVVEPSVKIKTEDQDIYVVVNQKILASHITVDYKDVEGCIKPNGNIYTSLDNEKWSTELTGIPDLQISERDMIKNNKLTFYFPGTKLQYIRIHMNSASSCLLNSPKVALYKLQ